MRTDELRAKVVTTARNYLGYMVADGSHKQIIDLYNTITPLPRGYKMAYSAPWCAAFVSAVFHKLGLDFPKECSCAEMIELYKAKGQWVEDDAYRPQEGDLLFYDWQDGSNYAATDNKGAPDHVGIITLVTSNTISVIEGNKGNAVGIRSLPINGRYIRGFATPDYDGAAAKITMDKTSSYRETIKKTCGLADATLDYLQDYKYGDDLLRKIAEALI